MTTLTDAMRSSIQYYMTGVHTAIPATFIDFDETDRSATVQPSINKNYMDDTTARLPVIHKVPVMFPFGGGSSVTFPINPGDYCLLIVCERSLEEWKRLGIDEKPIDRRKFNLSDAVAIPGLVPFTETMQPIDDNFTIRYGDSSIRITQSGQIQINSGNELVSVNAGGNVNVTAGGQINASSSGDVNVTSNGTIRLNGSKIALGNSFTTLGPVELIKDLILLSEAIELLGTTTPVYEPLAALFLIFREKMQQIQGTL